MTDTPRNPMATRYTAADRLSCAARAAGAQPVAYALHQLAEDLNAPGDHAYWGLIAAAIAPDAATDAELADLAGDLAQHRADAHAATEPDDPEPLA